MATNEPPQSSGAGAAGPTAAVLTPTGRGAVTAISITGTPNSINAAIDCHFTAANGRPLPRQTPDRIRFGKWCPSDATEAPQTSGETEEVVVVRRDEWTVEICCHGGPMACERILSDLRRQGVSVVSWREQLTENSTFLVAELQSVLAHATTRRTALKLLELQAILPVEFTRLSRIASDIQAGQVVSDSESSVSAFSSSLAASLRWAPFGLHLTTPWRVVLAGRPNVGKSTLMNALAGFHRAIVFDEPGTTRDVVSVETALHGWPVLLLDTAGIRDSAKGVEREGVARSRRALADADCVCLLLDASSPLTAEDQQLLKDVSAFPRSIVIASKVDLGSQWGMPDGSLLPVSAVTGFGLDKLIREIVRQLVPDEAPAMAAVPITPRQVSLLTLASQAVDQADFSSAAARLSELNHGRSF